MLCYISTCICLKAQDLFSAITCLWEAVKVRHLIFKSGNYILLHWTQMLSSGQDWRQLYEKFRTFIEMDGSFNHLIHNCLTAKPIYVCGDDVGGPVEHSTV